MRRRLLASPVAAGAVAAALGTGWIAFPTRSSLEITPPLRAWRADDISSPAMPHSADFAPLAKSFHTEVYRSFCGPASLATVLGAYGAPGVDQRTLFPSFAAKVETFYSGMSLDELAELARTQGLQTELVYADTIALDAFRERLKENLDRGGDFVLVNYDRRVLKQSGAGHISPIGAYDEARDAFLVLDQAAYKYPFTWVPAALLYEAAHTRDGGRYRGVLLIHAAPANLSAVP